MDDCRELSDRESALRGLPSRAPIHPYEELDWFFQERHATPESRENERHGRGQGERMEKN
jgi:hypothetical protein